MQSKKIYISLIIGCICCSLGACSSSDNIFSGPNTLAIYPPPPDTTRIQFLTCFSTSTDIIGKRSGFMKFLAGTDEPIQIVKPYGIAIHKGKIYICDTRINALQIIDLKKRSFEIFSPKGLGVLKKPVNCFVDTAGLLYVADTERKQIVIFDKEGEYLNAVGDGADDKPTDVLVYTDKIYVADLKNHNVKVYLKSDRSLVDSIPNYKTEPEGQLYTPTNICVQNDRLYVSDIGSFTVKEFTLQGEYLRTYGYGAGDQPGTFTRPKGIAVDKEGNMYVVDSGFENVQIFNAEGKMLMFFGGPYKGPGDMWLPVKVVIDYDNLGYFDYLVNPRFSLQYLIFVVNQFGPDKITVYGFVKDKK